MKCYAGTLNSTRGRTWTVIRKFAHYWNRALLQTTSETDSAPKDLEFRKREIVKKIKESPSAAVWSPNFLLGFRQNSRKVLVGFNTPIMACAEAKKLRGLNAIMGKERLFESNYHCNFMTEKPAWLMETLELMNSAGFVHKFQGELEIELYKGPLYKGYASKEHAAREDVVGDVSENGIASKGMFLCM